MPEGTLELPDGRIIDECNYVDYQISVTIGTGTPASVAYTLNASKFLPLR